MADAKHKTSPQLPTIEELIETTADTVRQIFREDNIKIKKSTLRTGMAQLLLQLAKGETPANTAITASSDEPLKYFEAGDLLHIAFEQFRNGHKKEALQTVCTAFASEDCPELLDIIVKCNTEADQAVLAQVQAEDSAETAAAETDSPAENNNDDEATDEDNNIDQVIAALSKDADDDDDYVGEDDDYADDEDEDDEDEDDEDDEDEDDDDDEDEDDDNKNSKVTAKTKELLEKLRDHPDIIAGANKLARTNQPDTAKKVEQFLTQAAAKLAA